MNEYSKTASANDKAKARLARTGSCPACDFAISLANLYLLSPWERKDWAKRHLDDPAYSSRHTVGLLVWEGDMAAARAKSAAQLERERLDEDLVDPDAEEGGLPEEARD